MKRLLLITAAVLGLGILGYGAETIVTVKAIPPAGSLKPGQPSVLTLELAIREQFHINSDKPLESFLIPTTVSFAPHPGVEFGKPVFPAVQPKKLAVSDKPMSVYEGSVRITAEITPALDIKEKEIVVDTKQQRVSMPLKRFSELMDYVEDVESKLLATEINLREADQVSGEMEMLVRGGAAAEPLSRETMQNVQRTLETLPTQVWKTMGSKGFSIRRLAMMTSIPYTTLHRYLTKGQAPSLQNAAKIVQAMGTAVAAKKLQSVEEEAKG